MANAVVGALNVILGIDTAAFRDGLNNATKSLKQVGERMQAVGRTISMSVTAPVVGFGYTIARVAGDFEKSMNQVAAVSGATGDELTALRDLAKELGATTQFSASDAADAMGFLAMAGFEVNEILSALPGTLQLAASAQMDMASAADIVSNVLSGYNMEVSELGRVNDVLVKAFTASNTNLQQLGEAMKYAGPIAAAAGVNFEEATAALGLMGSAGIQASMAGTALRGAISSILRSTPAMREAMAEAGLSFTDAQGKILPLVEIIEQLEPHADNAGLLMELFGQRAGPAMAALVSQGSGALRDLTAELEDSAGTAERVGAVQMEGFQGAMNELQSAFEGLQIAIADSGLLEFLTEMATKLANGIQYLSETNPQILKFGTIAAGLAAALGPVILALGFLAAGIAAIGLPVAAAIAGIGALTAIVVAFWPEIKAAGQAVIEFGTNALDWIVEKIKSLPEFFAAIPGQMAQIGRDILDGLLSGLREKWESLKSTASSIASSVVDTVRGVFQTQSPSKVFHEIGVNVVEGLTQGIGTRAESAKDMVGNLAQDIGQTFADILKGATDFRSGLANILGNLGSSFLNRGINTGLGAIGIPGFARGTNFAPGGLALVGERGPELVNLPRGSQVTPNHELGGLTRVELILSPDLQARIIEEANQGAVQISQQAVRSYDRGLPARIRDVNRDSRFMGGR